MFWGARGRDRAFFLMPRGEKDLDIPSDMLGITPLTYDPSKSELISAVGSARNKLMRRINELRGKDNQLSLTGEWKQKWKNSQPSWDDCVEGKATIIQTGFDVYAEFECQGIIYTLQAEISNGNLVTGIWKSPNGGPGYVGALQLKISQNARKMSGKWVGIDSIQSINADEWLWERES